MGDLIRDPINSRLHRMAQIAASTPDAAAGEALHGAIAAVRALLDLSLPDGPHEQRMRRMLWRDGYDAARLDGAALAFDALGLGSRPGGVTVREVGSSLDYDPPCEEATPDDLRAYALYSRSLGLYGVAEEYDAMAARAAAHEGGDGG